MFSYEVLDNNIFRGYVQNFLKKELLRLQIWIQRLKINRDTMFYKKVFEKKIFFAYNTNFLAILFSPSL